MGLLRMFPPGRLGSLNVGTAAPQGWLAGASGVRVGAAAGLGFLVLMDGAGASSSSSSSTIAAAAGAEAAGATAAAAGGPVSDPCSTAAPPGATGACGLTGSAPAAGSASPPAVCTAAAAAPLFLPRVDTAGALAAPPLFLAAPPLFLGAAPLFLALAAAARCCLRRLAPSAAAMAQRRQAAWWVLDFIAEQPGFPVSCSMQGEQLLRRQALDTKTCQPAPSTHLRMTHRCRCLTTLATLLLRHLHGSIPYNQQKQHPLQRSVTLSAGAAATDHSRPLQTYPCGVWAPLVAHRHRRPSLNRQKAAPEAASLLLQARSPEGLLLALLLLPPLPPLHLPWLSRHQQRCCLPPAAAGAPLNARESRLLPASAVCRS